MKPKILIIEDDFSNRMLMKEILSDSFEIDTITDSTLALDYIMKNNYDLLIIDINLPFGISGFDLITKIRELENYKNTPVVAITAYIIDFPMEKCIQQGFNYYVQKPFDIKEFKKLVNDIISKN